MKLIKAVFLLQAVFWFGLSVFHFFGFLAPENTLMAGLLFVDGAIFLGLFFIIAKKHKLIYCFATFFVVANIILTITDQFGLADLVVLIVDVILLFSLIIWYKQQHISG
jgi:hypothetical protein